MTATPKHYETPPEDRISFSQKIIYGVGAFVNNLLAASIGGMMIILNLGFGMDPALVGLLGGLPRLFDAFTDPLMGFISDRTKSKWGRRRIYIFWGAISAGIIFALLWQLPEGKSDTFYFVYFLIGSILFYLAYTVYATPWVALGYELTPDYHERTRLMGVQNFIGQIPYLIAPWFLWIVSYKGLFEDQASGAGWLAIVIAIISISVGIIPAIFLREKYKQIAQEEGDVEVNKMGKIILSFFKDFFTTLKSKPFMKICIATFLVFNGFMLISSFQFYVIIYYVFSGNQTLGAEYAGYAGTIQSIATFVVIILMTWLSTKIGKRRAFFVSTGISMIGYLLKWVCYNPELPWMVVIPSPLIAFGLGGLFVLMPSMIADVVDVDELHTYQRREGMYGAIYWWMVKLGIAVALAGGGVLLNATGFDVAFEGNQAPSTITLMRIFDAGIPFISSAIAIWVIALFPITEQKAREIRLQLESRRGKPNMETK